MRSLLIAIYFLGFASGHLALAEDKWLVCQKDSDCIKVTEVCGAAGSVNKKFKTKKEEEVKRLQMVASCLALTPEQIAQDKALKPFCDKGKCSLK